MNEPVAAWENGSCRLKQPSRPLTGPPGVSLAHRPPLRALAASAVLACVWLAAKAEIQQVRLFHTLGLELDALAHCQMAAVLAPQHQTAQVIAHYNEALRLRPNFTDALNNLAWIRAANAQPEFRDGPEAVRLAERACELTGYQKPMLVGTLAAAYAEAGRFAEAVATAQKACALASDSGERGLLAKNRELLELYRAGQPYHEPAAPPPIRTGSPGS
jgi:tetratricopeptide (TPR) repeat protein